MAWYRTGTATVTNGSATVTGAGTDFVSNALAGDGWRGPDGRLYEIARVVSAGELTLAEPYASGSAGGQPFAIQPTQSYMRDVALAAATLLATFGAVRDGIGQGLIGDGTLAAPGIRFASDQDTGIRRPDTNVVALVAGGKDAMVAGLLGVTLFCNGARSVVGTAQGAGVDTGRGLHWAGNSAEILIPSDGVAGWVWQTDGRISIRSLAGVEKAIFPAGGGMTLAGGNLLAGIDTGICHTFRKGSVQGEPVLEVYNACRFYVSSGPGWNGGATVLGIIANSATGRSISAGGTINASGADYAEYMTKAAGCGTIAAGDVCGVDVDGKLTRTWADARSFVVKSTDPAYVGGDSWSAALPPRPESPGEEPAEPAAPLARPDDEAALDAWREIVDAYPAQLAAWRAAHAAWQTASDAYAHDLPVWDAALEAERVKVDRIAFCGQVPVNVTGDFEVGDYLIAAPSGAGIKAIAISSVLISFAQYCRRLGKVWAVRDGRAWIDVQHG